MHFDIIIIRTFTSNFEIKRRKTFRKHIFVKYIFVRSKRCLQLPNNAYFSILKYLSKGQVSDVSYLNDIF